MKREMLKRPVVIVAALALNNVIGVRNTLPWRLSSDLKRFRALTMGKPVIMGRKTFESLPAGRPAKEGEQPRGKLPGRSLIVMSRASFPVSPLDGEVLQVTSLDEALRAADSVAERDGADEIIIAGGGEVFAQAMPFAERLYLTRVDASPGGDAFFPAVSGLDFKEIHKEEHQAGEHDDHTFTFIDYERQNAVF